jgi:hypothetical protein
MEQQNVIWQVILGAVLATATSFVIQVYSTWSAARNNRRNLVTILRLEMKNVIIAIDRLVDAYGSKSFFDYKLLDQIDRNIQRFESIRDKVIYLRHNDKKEAILSYFNDLSLFATDARVLENYFSGPLGAETPELRSQKADYCNKERQLILLKTVDLKRRTQELITYLER